MSSSPPIGSPRAGGAAATQPLLEPDYDEDGEAASDGGGGGRRHGTFSRELGRCAWPRWMDATTGQSHLLCMCIWSTMPSEGLGRPRTVVVRWLSDQWLRSTLLRACLLVSTTAPALSHLVAVASAPPGPRSRLT